MAGKADASTKNKETVLKFIANSFYGVLGWPQFRLYKPELAAQITRLGRSINQFLQDHAKQEHYATVYGDTDSVFLAGITSIDEGMVLQASFNEALKTWAKDNKSTLNPTVKFEKLYRRLLFKKVSNTRKVRHNKKAIDPIAAKKRYAGHLIWKDGQDENKVSYTGIEIKRSDQAKLTKDVLKQFLDCLLLEDNQDAACKTVRNAYQSVLKQRASLYDISMPKGVKDREADTAWVRGIKNAERLFGGKFPQGVKPRLIYLKGGDDAICIHDESDLQAIINLCRIDWELMADKVITNKMKTFVESIGQDWDIVIKDQKTLTDWF
jgi:DNA polymerase I